MSAGAWTAWDGRAAERALGIALLALGLALLVTAATDEGNVAWAERAGRALPVAPICSAIGTWIALAPGRARGELRALESLGRSSWQNARAAALGGAAIAAVAGAAIVWAPHVDVAGFYPEIGGNADIRFESAPGRGAFIDHGSGWRIEADGELVRAKVLSIAIGNRIPSHGRGAAGLATAAAGLALALIAAHTRRRAVWLGAAGGALAGTLLLFQAAAAGRLPAASAAVPPMVLLLVSWSRYREARWHPK